MLLKDDKMSQFSLVDGSASEVEEKKTDQKEIWLDN
jgi:hypothetical protein